MKELIFGTINPAKVAQVDSVLRPLGFNIQSLAGHNVSPVDEDGETAEANARKKAAAYARALGKQVLSNDTALYFNDLPDSQQPGLHVRRIQGLDRASDEQMLAYYTNLAKSMGDQIHAYWRYAFALARPSGECVSFTHDTPRIFITHPSLKVIEGYPLESIQVDPSTGRYISEMSEQEIAAFWQNSIGTPLAAFVQEHY